MGRIVDHLNRRRSKLPESDDDADVNPAGGWSREKLERMDDAFCKAMRRAHPERETSDAEVAA